MSEEDFEELEEAIDALPTTGYGLLYVLYAEGTHFIKIGRASNVAERIRQLQAGCPQQLILLFSTPCENAPALERLMHDHFAPYHLHGAWFALPQDIPTILPLLAFLYSHSQPHLLPPVTEPLDLDYESPEKRILAALEEAESPLTTRQIMARIGMPEARYGRMRRRLHDLFHKGLVGKSDRGLYRARVPSTERRNQ